MRRNWMTVGLVVAVSALAEGSALAQAPSPRANQLSDMPTVTSFDASSGALPRTGAEKSQGAMVPAPGGAAAPPVDSRPRTATPLSLRPQLRASCRRIRRSGGRRFRCVVRRVVGSERRIVRRCRVRASSKRKAARRCINRVRGAQTTLGGTGVGAHASAVEWHGFPNQGMAAVGKIVYVEALGWGTCSGTVVSRTLVLTAGHCLTGDKPEEGWFAPGATAGQGDDTTAVYAPYGWWQFRRSRSWVAADWAATGDSGRDWGLLEVLPDAQGRRIGDVVGSWNFTANIGWGAGARAYLTGYPASGWWATSAGLWGRAQYACNATWDGLWQAEGSGYEIKIGGCPMNGGASGGPWFIQLSDGSWTIGGVNNRCQTTDTLNRPDCQPYGDALLSAYMNDAMISFWNAVVPQLQYE